MTKLLNHPERFDAKCAVLKDARLSLAAKCVAEWWLEIPTGTDAWMQQLLILLTSSAKEPTTSAAMIELMNAGYSYIFGVTDAEGADNAR